MLCWTKVTVRQQVFHSSRGSLLGTDTRCPTIDYHHHSRLGRMSKRACKRMQCCPMCSSPVLPEINALFNHMVEFHYTRQQRGKETCVRQSAHTCTILLCIRRSVEAIVAQLPRVAAPAAAQPPAPAPQPEIAEVQKVAATSGSSGSRRSTECRTTGQLREFYHHWNEADKVKATEQRTRNEMHKMWDHVIMWEEMHKMWEEAAKVKAKVKKHIIN